MHLLFTLIPEDMEIRRVSVKQMLKQFLVVQLSGITFAPKGDVRFINESIAKRTRERWGAKGESICSGGAPCMTPYGSSN